MTTDIATSDPALEIPLGISIWDIANRFADAQPHPAKAEQVRRNTLAVLAVRQYLSWHHIQTDIAASDCWNPAIRALEDVADLILPPLGRVECRPVLPGTTTCELPLETLMERMGYFWVELDLDGSTGRLVGFAEPSFDEDALAVVLEHSQLLSLEDFHTFLNRREKIAELINRTYATLIPAEADPSALETEWAWITLKYPSHQWKLRAKQSTEKYQTFESVSGSVLGGALSPGNPQTSPEVKHWNEQLQNFFDDLADFVDDSE
jgi:hypothetical protein